MSKFQILRETAQYPQDSDLSTATAARCTGTVARRRRDGEVKCGNSRIDIFCATFKFAHL